MSNGKHYFQIETGSNLYSMIETEAFTFINNLIPLFIYSFE